MRETYMTLRDEKYTRGSDKMLRNEIRIFVEGGLNKAFYSQFSEINKNMIENNGSCSKIIKKVSESENYFGIIDNDFRLKGEFVEDRVFRIDYYSIENIVILNHSKYVKLREKLDNILNSVSITDYAKNKLDVNILRIKNRPTDFKFESIAQHHPQYHSYITSQILDASSYYKYMDLKKCVTTFMKYIHEKEGSFKNKHILELYDNLQDKTIKSIFDDREFIRISNSLLQNHH